MKSMPELLQELDSNKRLRYEQRYATILEWFAEAMGVQRNEGESDEQLAGRMKERLAQEAMEKALKED